ncbi:MAG: hypothetical protein ABI419_03895 [Ginsengibacter sp.]
MAKAIKSQRDLYRFQYAVKFICTANIPGTSQTTDAFVPGSYQTAVNIHNPQNVLVKMRKKIASPIEISKYFSFSLKPDAVERITCKQLSEFGVHIIHGFEGFLVIDSTHSIDVVAVYTAAGTNHGQVAAMDVEQIKERKL